MIEICSLCLSPRPCRCRRSNHRANPKAFKRWRSKEYLAFVRTLPCCIPDCKNWQQAEPHHAGERGFGEKVDDFLCIPLCRKHHEQAHQKGLSWFWYEQLTLFQIQTVAAAIQAGVLRSG